MDNLKIKVILGSTREGRFGDKAAKWVFEIASKKEGIEVELLDLRDYAMPFFDQATSPSMIKEAYANEAVARWTRKIAEADAFVVCTPEYNHGTSAVLKNAFDWVSKEWHDKAVGFVAWGTVGGARAIQQLQPVVVEAQMAPMRNAVYIMAPWMLLNLDGTLKPNALDPYQGAAEGMLTQLLWWAKALKAARSTQ